MALNIGLLLVVVGVFLFHEAYELVHFRGYALTTDLQQFVEESQSVDRTASPKNLLTSEQRGSGPCKPAHTVSAALVLFGVPKKFQLIWKSYFRNIVENNPHVNFEATLHMYSDITSVNTPRNGELNATVDTIDTVQ